jgi:RNA polymerase sigma-70 factor (TIGR02957 family)
MPKRIHGTTRPVRVLHEPMPDEAEGAATVFEDHRRELLALAYRMLGSIADAEDVIQEAYLRWRQVDTAAIASPGGWLSTVVTRLAMNHLKSAQRRRKTYVGPWLPEPLLTSELLGQQASLERADCLSIAFLTLLERLTPRERAVFVLRHVLDYEYAEIGTMLALGEANCRQIFHRAKLRLGEGGARYRADPDAHRQLLQAFLQAVTDGDVGDVVRLLSDDAGLWADGGGRVRAAALRPVRGASAVAQFVVGAARKFGRDTQVTLQSVNGDMALVASRAGVLQRVVTIDTIDDRIVGIYIVANPEKLDPITRAMDSAT